MREPLYRSRTDRMLAGVAGGMADWLNLDPSVVRLVWALLVLAGGIGLLLYIVAAIVIPEAPIGYRATPGGPSADPSASPGAPQAARGGSSGGAMLFGGILVVIGAWLLFDRYVDIDIDTSWFVPGALIVLGIVLVVGAMGRSRG